MKTVRTKAGDTFSFAGQVDLPAGTAWAGRGQIRLENGDMLADLDVEISGEAALWVIVSKPAPATAAWPRPATPGDSVILYFDYELFDPDGDTVISSDTVRVLVEYDPTRV